ncbi:hypothetical protein QQS21_012679 [Conoideocrella luteorostrata]|uniref:Beta-lactamase-related domain-containing protein n=1 Tax=Conoideocrella luteorostrata TaxID=1105319 RepID=A0AAJ0CDK4_9HYPO|nr:hypothetical protein QQS21_012679 [Conoideocrella luteorostrata]
MRLIDEGRFTLGSTIAELLMKDDLTVLLEDSPNNHISMIEKITVKQLMSHTAGLSQGHFLGYSTAADSSIPPSRQILRGRHPANTMRTRLESLPGQVFAYSGGGITVLQIILETVTGKDFASIIQELVLEPLGMTRSRFGALPQTEKNVADAHYTGYTRCEDGHRVLPEQAAASLWKTPSDLLKVVQAIQKSLDGPDGFLRRDTAKQMLTEVQFGMALSWFVPGRTKITFKHGGVNDPGFRCILIGYADLSSGGERDVPNNCGMAIMTNSAMGDTAVWMVAQAIAHLKQ